MAKKYNIGSKSDMRKLQKDLQKTVTDMAQKALKQTVITHACPHCSAILNVKVGSNVCPYCKNTVTVNIKN